MTADLSVIFLEGAAASLANDGVGIWDNPYLTSSVADEQKADAWDRGWEWQAERQFRALRG